MTAAVRHAPAFALAPLAALLSAASPAPQPGPAQPPPVARPAPSPNEIVAAAPGSDWVRIAPADLLVMDLAPDAAGAPRGVVIQLIAPPISRGWVANIRTLARAHWWDGTAITRVQDNYVVQWGDPNGGEASAKPLPPGLIKVPQRDYTVGVADLARADVGALGTDSARQAVQRPGTRNSPGRSGGSGDVAVSGTRTGRAPNGWHERDSYAGWVGLFQGWPMAADGGGGRAGPGAPAWPVHCYGMVGVGRDMPPDTGTGAELYVVIGQAPRHLDRNIALVGRVIEGIEHLSSLPRGTGPLGVYRRPERRVPIRSIRLASQLPPGRQPQFEYLSTESSSFARYADARANRRDPFFIRPAGGVDICNLPVPIRRVAPAR